MRDKLIVVGLLALAAFVGLNLFFNRKSDEDVWVGVVSASEGGGVLSAQIVGTGFNAPVSLGGVSNLAAGRFPAISQRDKSQYASEEEWRTWASSACSAAALTMIFNGYGKSLRVTEVLAELQQRNAIKAGAGLYRYDSLSSVAEKYGLRAVYSEDKNLEAHFDRLMSYVRQGLPVIVNVLDASFFPNGHFVVATGLNSDGTVAILNPDPTSDKSVSQNWPVEGLKLYFSRMTRSAAIVPR